MRVGRFRGRDYQRSVRAFFFHGRNTVTKSVEFIPKGGEGFCFRHGGMERISFWIATCTGDRLEGFSHHAPTWVLGEMEDDVVVMDS